MAKSSSTDSSVQFLDPGICFEQKKRRKKKNKRNEGGLTAGNKSLDSSSSFSEPEGVTNYWRNNSDHSTSTPKKQQIENTATTRVDFEKVLLSPSTKRRKEKQLCSTADVNESSVGRNFLPHLFASNIPPVVRVDSRNGVNGVPYFPTTDTNENIITMKMQPKHTMLMRKRRKEQQTEYKATSDKLLRNDSFVLSPQRKKRKHNENNSITFVASDKFPGVTVESRNRTINGVLSSPTTSMNENTIALEGIPENTVLTPKKKKKEKQTEYEATNDIHLKNDSLIISPQHKKKRKLNENNSITCVAETFDSVLFASNKFPDVTVESRNRTVNGVPSSSTTSMNENTIAIEGKPENTVLTPKKKKKEKQTEYEATNDIHLKNDSLVLSPQSKKKKKKKKRKNNKNNSITSVAEIFDPDLFASNKFSNVPVKSSNRTIDGVSSSTTDMSENTITNKIQPEDTVLTRKKIKEKQQTEYKATNDKHLRNHSYVLSPQRKKKRKHNENNSITFVAETSDPVLFASNKFPDVTVESRNRTINGVPSSPTTSMNENTIALEGNSENTVLTTKKKQKKQQTKYNAKINVDRRNDSSILSSHPRKLRKQNADNISIRSVNDLCALDDSFLAVPLKPRKPLISPQVNGIMYDSDSDFDELLKEAILDKSQHTNSKEVFEDLCIVLYHDIPPLHSVDTRPCCIPRKEEKEMLKTIGWKQGPFNKFEDTIIMANWEKFSKEHHIFDPTLLLDMRRNRNSHQKREFLQYLGNGLPSRALYQIYQRFHLLCCPRKGPFTKKEDELILKAVASTPEPFATLSHVLKRHKHAIYKRYKMLKDCTSDNERDTTTRLKWNKELAERVIKALIKVSQASSLSHFKDAVIPADIWHKVGVEAGVPHWKLRQFWSYKLHTQLFADLPVCENKVQEKIVLWLRNKNFLTEKEISWADSVYLVPGATAWFMWSMFRNIRKIHGAKEFQTLREFVNALYQNRSIFKVNLRYLTRYKVNDDLSLRVLNDG